VSGIDAALKSANVQLTGPMKNVGSGLCNAVITGDVAAVKAAIDTAADTAAQLGDVVSAHVIARPDDSIEKVIPGTKKPAARK
jgi:microcompartment protein CcmL/EutN